VIVDPSKVFYDPNTYEHHHFYDVVSGHLTDIDAADFKISGLPMLPPGVITEGIDIIVRIRHKRLPSDQNYLSLYRVASARPVMLLTVDG